MKLHLVKIIPGNFPNEKQTYESLLIFRNANITITETSAKIYTKSNGVHTFSLEVTQNNDFGRIYLTTLTNGTKVRVIRPTELTLNELKKNSKDEFLNFGSTNLVGFAVKFHLVPDDRPDKLDYIVGPKMESEM